MLRTNREKILAVTVFCSVTWCFCETVWGTSTSIEWLRANSGELASWVQAIGSIVAIYAAGRIARSQFENEKIERESINADQDMQYAHICFEMCKAVESIARTANDCMRQGNESEAGSDKARYYYQQATAVNRFANLQSSILTLLHKDMPSELMEILFSVQKHVGIYTDAISLSVSDVGFTQFLDFEKTRNDLLSEIDLLKRRIDIWMAANASYPRLRRL